MCKIASPAISRVGSGGGGIGVHRADFSSEIPVDRPRQLRQRVIHVDDLVGRERNRSCLPLSRRSRGASNSLRSRLGRRNHGLRFEESPTSICKKIDPQPRFPANPIALPAISIARQSLQDISQGPTHLMRCQRRTIPRRWLTCSGSGLVTG